MTRKKCVNPYLSGVALMCLLAVGCDNRWEPTDNPALNEVKQTFSDLPLYPGMVEVDHSATWGNNVSYGKTYKSSAAYDDVRRFYVDNLTGAGWELAEERPMSDWWRDLGGRYLRFRRAGYEFSIQYAGKDASYGWDYGLDIGKKRH